MKNISPKTRSRRRNRSGGMRQREGIALIIAMTALAVLAVLLADMHENTSTAFVVATNARDELRAEVLARSSIDLTRMLVSKEPQIRLIVGPIFQMMIGRPPPQLPVWRFADELLTPFCSYGDSKSGLASAGIDFSAVEGLGKTGGECHIDAMAENSKINVNDPLLLDGMQAKKSISTQFYSLMGGFQSPNPYAGLFEREDSEGQFNQPLDIVAAMCDWWDFDQEATVFDPGTNTVTSSGSEDEIYRRYRDPYIIKNAALDSVEEIRLIRGVNDDFWATFIQPDPESIYKERVTIYGSGAINPNEAAPEVLLSRVCTYVADQPLCADPLEALKFIQLVSTVRGIAPVPFFASGRDFVNFIEGKGGSNDLYPMLTSFMGTSGPLIFKPVIIPGAARGALESSFITQARILTVVGHGKVGRADVSIRTVINFHDRWTPPPPNAGIMPLLGIFHYYRIE